MSAFEDINGVPASELAFSDPSMKRTVEPAHLSSESVSIAQT